jgi:8-amino-7-oxononanoate synthase
LRDLSSALRKRRVDRLYRSRRVAEGPQGVERIIDGRRVVSFCSNDYLGLANHPAVVAAFKRAADEYGVGSGAAHLINGHTRAHHALEEELAEFTGRERALLFSTGYMANLGIVSALVGRGDSVYEDRLNHASLIDAALLSGARFIRYQHADVENLQLKLGAHARGEKLIVTDGVFSMDGDIAPVPALAEIAARQSAWLAVDDAHGIGVLGRDGRGTLEHFGIDHQAVPILMGTLGKALGTFGAFAAGSADLIETLIQQARTYIYTTAPPPAMAEATRAALRIAQQESWRRHKLRELIYCVKETAAQFGLRLMPSETPIQPLLIGDAAMAKSLSDALFEHGFLITAIRPPTVPRGTARLRLTLSVAHEQDHIDRVLSTLHSLIERRDMGGAGA